MNVLRKTDHWPGLLYATTARSRRLYDFFAVAFTLQNKRQFYYTQLRDKITRFFLTSLLITYHMHKRNKRKEI